jgi:hypothetical protein
MWRNSPQATIAALVRDPGVIVGIPILLIVGLNLGEPKRKADEAQITAEVQSTLLKETVYEPFEDESRTASAALADLNAIQNVGAVGSALTPNRIQRTRGHEKGLGGAYNPL